MASKDRLLELFKNVKDKTIQHIIAEVVLIEKKNRSSMKDNFPRQDVRNVIDANARKIELEQSKQ